LEDEFNTFETEFGVKFLKIQIPYFYVFTVRASVWRLLCMLNLHQAYITTRIK
jgi:hypothetical protein